MDWASGKRSNGEGEEEDGGGALFERDAGEGCGRCANRSAWLDVGLESFFGFFDEAGLRLVFGDGKDDGEEEDESGGEVARLCCSWRRRECGVGTASTARRASRIFSVNKSSV